MISRSPLSGGNRRRRIGRRWIPFDTKRRRRGSLAALALALLAPAAVAGALWLAFGRDDGGTSSGSVPLKGTPIGSESAGSLPPPESPAAVASRGVDAFSIRFTPPPKAGLVFDVRTGEILWRRNPARRLPVASLTKIMTALLVAERTQSRETVRITRAALNYRGSGVGVLPRGKRVPVNGLLHGLLLVSGNDAAIALAGHISGTERKFVRTMNRRARALGLSCTHYRTSYGLSALDRSCAADLATLARLAMREKRIARIVRKRQAAVRFPVKGRRLFLTTTNPLLRTGYRGTIGLKTGFTNRAGRCLVAVVRRGRRTLGVVLLDSPDPNKQARKLLSRGFREG